MKPHEKLRAFNPRGRPIDDLVFAGLNIGGPEDDLRVKPNLIDEYMRVPPSI